MTEIAAVSRDRNQSAIRYVTALDLWKDLMRVAWISNDVITKSKLREIALKWISVHELLTPDRNIPDDMLNVDGASSNLSIVSSGEDGASIEPSTKRIRSSSEESIIEPKSEKLTDSSTSSMSTPEETANGEWECKKCTFINPADATTSCTICGWFKSRSNDATGASKKPSKKEMPVETYILGRVGAGALDERRTISKADDKYSEILSRSSAGLKEYRLTGPPEASSEPSECTIYTSRFNLLACGQAQEESTWINALERDVFAKHNLDEELLFTKRWLAAKSIVEKQRGAKTDSSQSSPEEKEEISLDELKREYAQNCNDIVGTAFPDVKYVEPSHALDWKDWMISGVHSEEYLRRLQVIHSELVKESLSHFTYDQKRIIIELDVLSDLLMIEETGRPLINSLLAEPSCDLELHCLSHVEGDNVMDRFLLPAAFERANLIFSALSDVWLSGKTAFIAARPPGHHCPSFEDRLIGLSAEGGSAGKCQGACVDGIHTKLERAVCLANGLQEPPREYGMGFCSLNGLAVAIKRFLQINNPEFERRTERSIRVAVVDLDIHAGNGTELVFRDSRSVLHISFHRYGWLKAMTAEGGIAERVMPGTHYFRDIGGILGKNAKRAPGQGYSVNITLRKADGNAEVLSAFEGVALPVLQQFMPDVVVVACGFDGLKLSPIFTQRWGEESCPGMDAEYTPSLFGYIVNRIRKEVQNKVIAATEGGYDPVSVGLAARCVVKGLKGFPISKPPLRIFNSDWMHQLNNIFLHQGVYWNIFQ